MRNALLGLILLFPLILAFAHPQSAVAKDQGWIGVQVEKIDEPLRAALDFKGEGLLVKEVFEDSPASKGGLKAGDIITKLGDKDVNDLAGFVDMVRDAEPGSKVKMTVIRKGKTQNLEIEVGEREEPENLKKYGADRRGPRLMKMRAGVCLGVRVEDLNEDLGEYFQTKDGALVMSVLDDTPAAKAGLKAGDVLTEIDGSRIHDADDVVESLEHKEAGDQVAVKVLRKGKEQNFTVTLKECEGHGFFGMGGPHGEHFSGCIPGHEGWMGMPDRGVLDLKLKDLDEYLGSEDFDKDIEKRVEVIREMSDEKLEKIEESLKELKESMKELEKKLEK